MAAWAEVRHGVPMLISILLLSYPAIGVTSYLERFPLRDVSTGLPQTPMVPPDARLYGSLRSAQRWQSPHRMIALAVVFVDRRTSGGYELRMRAKTRVSLDTGGCGLDGKRWTMFDSGAIAGLVGAIIVLGSQFRFIDGALVTPAYTWSGLMAALLVSGEPVGTIAAALFFAALQTGGFAMQREIRSPRADARITGDRDPVPRHAPRTGTADVIQSLFTPFLFQSAAEAITPILFAALAGVFCGRVGVFNLALEGQMLVGAFAAIVGSYFGHSAFVGVAAAIAAATVFSLILGYGATIFRGDPVVIGIGMNLLASGLTAYLLRVSSASVEPSATPTCRPWRSHDPGLVGVPCSAGPSPASRR